jgi:GNAT superfamily N-acetyltransferase
MSDLVLGLESITALWDEIMPILERHRQEIAVYKDIPLRVNRAGYDAAQANGALKFYTMREDGRLIAYNAFIVAPNAHYLDALAASEDVLYLDPSRRALGLGRKFILWVDSQLAALGCTYISRKVKTAHDFGALLKRCGYDAVEVTHHRRLAPAAAPADACTTTAPAGA